MRVAATLQRATTRLASSAAAPLPAPRPLAAAHAARAAAAAPALAHSSSQAPAPALSALARSSRLQLPQARRFGARSVATAAGGDGAGMATAILGTGCFWCTEACYKELKGVKHVVSGYAGGSVNNPSYEQVCGKMTGHIECVKVTFDPAAITYRELLEVFFTIHDPTTPDRQGNDVGPQYASAIFYTDDEQLATAKEVMAESQKLWPAPIVTKLLPLAADGAAKFWDAENYHWDYYTRNPKQGYCMFVVEPKVAKFRAKWAAKLMK